MSKPEGPEPAGQAGRELGTMYRIRAHFRTVRTALIVGLACVAISIVLGVGVFAGTSLYVQYGAPQQAVNQRAWAERPQRYLASDCRGCHQDQAAQARGSEHDRLICESCHVPSVDHPGPIEGVVAALPAATSASCVACHQGVPGRPTGLPQVALDRHYPGALCISCHEAHSSAAVKPREVVHPLDHLPECITCHAPDGLKRFPADHRAAPDPVCLACHRQGASGA